ncbi:Uncharacterised protein [Acinetobacter baumannii]|nr:Uncharacterised protein [Acinetobacter baumannii]
MSMKARVATSSTGRRPTRSESPPANGITRVISATAAICTMNTSSSGRPNCLWAKVGIFTSTT